MNVEQGRCAIGIVCLATGVWMTTSQPVQSVLFTPPPDNASPLQVSGGASRGGFQFVPPSDTPTPARVTGGASRGDIFFIPHPDNATAPSSSGGASRDGVFIPAPDNASLETTASGASRANDYGITSDLFTGSTVSMLAVTPASFYGLTISERPTFMTYLPSSSAHQAVFRLKDASQAVVYEQTIPLDGTAGILTIQLSNDAPALVIDQYYQWFVTLQTETNLTPASPFVDAWIKRIEPTESIVQAQMSEDSLLIAETLAQSGIWYDTSALLATLQSEQNSEVMVAHWAELLSSVGLNTLVEVPLL